MKTKNKKNPSNSSRNLRPFHRFYAAAVLASLLTVPLYLQAQTRTAAKPATGGGLVCQYNIVASHQTSAKFNSIEALRAALTQSFQTISGHDIQVWCNTWNEWRSAADIPAVKDIYENHAKIWSYSLDGKTPRGPVSKTVLKKIRAEQKTDFSVWHPNFKSFKKYSKTVELTGATDEVGGIVGHVDGKTIVAGSNSVTKQLVLNTLQDDLKRDGFSIGLKTKIRVNLMLGQGVAKAFADIDPIDRTIEIIKRHPFHFDPETLFTEAFYHLQQKDVVPKDYMIYNQLVSVSVEAKKSEKPASATETLQEQNPEIPAANNTSPVSTAETKGATEAAVETASPHQAEASTIVVVQSALTADLDQVHIGSGQSSSSQNDDGDSEIQVDGFEDGVVGGKGSKNGKAGGTASSGDGNGVGNGSGTDQGLGGLVNKIEGTIKALPNQRTLFLDAAAKTCGDANLSGGHGVTVTKYYMGNKPGTVEVRVNTVSIPDKITIKCNGQVMVDSKLFLGVEHFSFSYTPFKSGADSNICVVTMTGEYLGTVWDYTLNCPK